MTGSFEQKSIMMIKMINLVIPGDAIKHQMLILQLILIHVAHISKISAA